MTVGGPHCAVGYLLDDGTIDLIRGKRIKSGDLAIMDEDGFVRVSGRTKDLIIRGGVNIAPLEIDAVLLKHPLIADAAAVGVPDKVYGEEVICYVVARPGGVADRSGGARALPGPPSRRKSAEAGLHRRGTAEKRPRQGVARQAQGRTGASEAGCRRERAWSPHHMEWGPPRR